MRFNRPLGIINIVMTLLMSTSVCALEKQTLDSLPDYQRAGSLSGNISSAGSDTLANMMTLWAEKFRHIYPTVNMQIQASGSSTAPPALTESTANLGPMSRKMKSREIQSFEKRHGYKPTEIKVAIDALAIFVHQDNPIKGLYIEDIDAIFSNNRACGAKSDINRWGDVGLNGFWQGKDIQLYGRNSVSGTYGYFKTEVLCKGDFKNSVNEQPGSASVVQSVSTSLNGIGYSGIGYKTSGARTVPIGKKGEKFIEANIENTVTGKYPLSRYLYIYINKHPNKPLSLIEREFIKMVLSRQGQYIVQQDGYIPLTKALVNNELNKLGLLH